MKLFTLHCSRRAPKGPGGGGGGETDLEVVYNLGLIFKVCLQYSYVFILVFKVPVF